MHAILYPVVAAAALLFSYRALERGGRARPDKDFALLGAILALTYAAFGLYLVLFPAALWARMPFACVGVFLPAAHLRFLEHFFPSGRERPLEPWLWAGGAALLVLYVLASAFVEVAHNPGVPERVLGVFVFAGFGLSLRRLGVLLAEAPTAVERARIRYLLGVMAAAVGFSALEGLGRMWDPTAVTSLAREGLLQRSLALQGPLPPVGTLFTGLYLFLLDRVRGTGRLLDLNELITQLATVAASAAVLAGVVGLAVFGQYLEPDEMLGALFLLFVCATSFLMVFPALRELLHQRLAPWLNRPGALLAEALEQLHRELPSVISVDMLSRVTLDRLHGSGRLRSAALYVYHPEGQQYRLQGHRTVMGNLTLPKVAARPFIDGFKAGERVYDRMALERRALAEDAAARLRILDGMNADLVVPIRTGEQIMGWLSLQDEANADGFSAEEVERLRDLAARMAVVLENIKGFEASKEQDRLVALGTMAAGLAHEIRNPLAGIKGAAQVIGQLPPEAHAEFLDIITNEVDRLGTVVTQFLDYARHFELRRELTDLNALVTQVLSLVRAERDQPEGARYLIELDPSLPRAEVDGDKLRQVLLNLLRNAREALPEGGGEVRVTTRLDGLDGPGGRRPAACVEVQDTGRGLSPEARASLFVPFFTTKPFGTGLGLAISQRIVQAHGGDLRAEGREGEGALFRVRLPLPDRTTAISLDQEQAEAPAPPEPA